MRVFPCPEPAEARCMAESARSGGVDDPVFGTRSLGKTQVRVLQKGMQDVYFSFLKSPSGLCHSTLTDST